MFGLNELGQQQFNAGLACAILSGAAVVIRVFCKFHHEQSIKSDDWWIFVGLAWYWASVAVIWWGSITGGGGKEMKDMLVQADKDNTYMKHIANYLESIFLGFTFVTTAIFACKLSILCFYRHNFLVKDSYRKASLALMVVVTVWFIATQIGNLLICQPIDSFWNRVNPGKCLNFNIMFLATGIVDTVLDLMILLFPVRVAFTLHLPKKTKIAVAGIFALGGFVVITNMIRIKYIYQPNQKYVSFAQAERWMNIHMVTAITCACLPIYNPLWSSVSTAVGNLVSRSVTSLRSILGSSTNNTNNKSYVNMGALGENSAGTSLNSKERDLEQGFAKAHLDKQVRSTVTVTSGHESDREPLHVPNGNIARSRDIEIIEAEA